MKKLTTCSCGAAIELEYVEIEHHTNEEGEESTNIEFECPKCEVQFDFFEWGFLEKAEAVEVLIEKLKENDTISNGTVTINSKGGVGKTN